MITVNFKEACVIHVDVRTINVRRQKRYSLDLAAAYLLCVLEYFCPKSTPVCLSTNKINSCLSDLND